jgi:hypothetical protein
VLAALLSVALCSECGQPSLGRVKWLLPLSIQ